MAVDGDVAAVDVEDAGHDRGAVELGAPVAPEDRRLLLGQDLDPLPHRHAILGVLDADASGPAAGQRPCMELGRHLERRVVDALRRPRGARRRCRRIRAGQGIAQRVLEVGHGSHVRARSLARSAGHAVERGSIRRRSGHSGCPGTRQPAPSGSLPSIVRPAHCNGSPAGDRAALGHSGTAAASPLSRRGPIRAHEPGGRPGGGPPGARPGGGAVPSAPAGLHPRTASRTSRASRRAR